MLTMRRLLGSGVAIFLVTECSGSNAIRVRESVDSKTKSDVEKNIRFRAGR